MERNASTDGSTGAPPAISSRKNMAIPTTGTRARAGVKSIPGSVTTSSGSVAASCAGVSAFCASLNDWARTASPRKAAEKSTASGTSDASTSSAAPAGRVKRISVAGPKRKSPDWKVSSMLPRLATAAASATSATAANFPATISRAGTGVVSSVSRVPRSFSPAAMSMAG